MSRPRCWICFKQLMYVNGSPVWAVHTDADGGEHKVHKDCLKNEQLRHEQELTQDHLQFRNRGAA